MESSLDPCGVHRWSLVGVVALAGVCIGIRVVVFVAAERIRQRTQVAPTTLSGGPMLLIIIAMTSWFVPAVLQHATVDGVPGSRSWLRR
jgi:hypothetical protein